MRKFAVLLAMALVATVGVGVVAAPNGAQALESDTVVANASSSWQTNGTVWSLAYVGGAVYLGGDFTSVRPPGAALGTGEVARNHIAAFDAQTGALLPFSHDLDDRPMIMAPSADGSTLYVGGDFATVDGTSRSRLAAFDTATGNLTSWAPRVNGTIRGIALKGAAIYLGGTFSAINGQARTNLGEVSATGSGSPLPWAPTADSTVFRVAVAPDGSRVFAGGYFSDLNGVARRGTGALDPDTGATLPWATASFLPPHSGSCTSDIRDIRVDSSNVYFAAEGTGGGCFDGTFAASQSDGALVWRNDCLGATQAVEIIGKWLDKGSHANNRSAAGAFGEQPQSARRHLLVEKLSDGTLGPWYPNTSGNPLGPRAFATDGTRLFVGGDFLNVNNRAQQGFTRFGGPPDLTRPRQPKLPAASSIEPGQVRLSWQATTDDDDETLVYRVFRDGSSTPLWTSPPVRSTFWILPSLSFTDTGLAPGSTHSYKVDAKEANGTNNSFKSDPVPVTVSAVDAPYTTVVGGDAPYFYWRLCESSGTVAADSSGSSRTRQLPRHGHLRAGRCHRRRPGHGGAAPDHPAQQRVRDHEQHHRGRGPERALARALVQDDHLGRQADRLRQLADRHQLQLRPPHLHDQRRPAGLRRLDRQRGHGHLCGQLQRRRLPPRGRHPRRWRHGPVRRRHAGRDQPQHHRPGLQRLLAGRWGQSERLARPAVERLLQRHRGRGRRLQHRPDRRAGQ